MSLHSFKVKNLRIEMDEMNNAISKLSERDSLSYLPPPIVDADIFPVGSNPRPYAYRGMSQNAKRLLIKHYSSSSVDGDRSEMSLNLSEDLQSSADVSDSRRFVFIHFGLVVNYTNEYL